MKLPACIFGGWAWLEQLYPDVPFTPEETFTESSLYFTRSLIGYYGWCLNVSVNNFGLRLRVSFPFGFGMKPIVIPWREVTECRRVRFGFVGQALSLQLRQWPHPINVGRFPWKYGDVYSRLTESWSRAKGLAANPKPKEQEDDEKTPTT